jgi:superfamily II DNA or RNA helicase
LDPTYSTELVEVWMLSEVPQKVRALLGLPDSDQGIDIVAKTKTGKYWAIQCKYRGNTAGSLTWREISTFTGLTFGVCKGFDFGLIAYTRERYTKVLDSAEHVAFLSSDTWSTLDAEFFKKLSEALAGKKDDLKPRTPRPHQKRAIEKAKEYFADKKNTRGKLIMPCGTGKSLTGFWIAEELGAKTVILAVPSLALIQQTLPVWLREYAARGENKMQWLCVCSDQTVTANTDSVVVHTQDLGYPCLTNKEEIKAWLKETSKASPRVIFTTYQSSKVIADALRESKTKVDLGIMDEAHKTVGQKDKLFSHLLFDENVPIARRIFMTATERRYAGQGDEVISMDDPEVYGDTFELLSFKEALEQESPILADYKVITMVISQKEVAKLIADNRYVRPTNAAWSEEVEAQMLASLIAYRKAARKHPIKHAVSFHSSIARAQAFRNFNDTYSRTKDEKLETFHVTGDMPSAVRKQIVSDFAKTDWALITNARCLTEGVDVPNIDCVIFADPKQSTIDIVQAVGRALRPSKGKKFGYILVPVIAHDENPEEFIGSQAFASVITVLRALGANDERIIEHFRAIHNGRRIKGGTVEIDMDERISQVISLENFAEKIEARVWGRLAQLSWQPYQQAKEYVRSLGLRSGAEWSAFCKGEMALKPKPADIPANPKLVYGDEFEGMGEWLGTGYIANQLRAYRPYKEALEFVHSLRLKSGKRWDEYCDGKFQNLITKPSDIPRNPTIYPEFQGMGEWVGTGRVANQLRKFRPYNDAVEFVRSLGLKNVDEWREYTQGKFKNLPSLPSDIPASPQGAYGDLFSQRGGMGSWLGTGRIANQLKEFLPYYEAVKFTRKLGLKTQSDWPGYCKGKRPDLPQKPVNIPNSPLSVYGEEFSKNGGWGAWLGTGRRKTGWKTYNEAVKFVHALGLKSQHDWLDYLRGEHPNLPEKPWDIPRDPANLYGEEFKRNGGWGAWLGTGNRKGGWKKYEEAIKFVHTLGLKDEPDWRAYTRGLHPELPTLPADIPRAPYGRYADFTKRGGWKAWLGEMP